MRKCITEDILAVISYLLTRLLLKQRQEWRCSITEPLSTSVASLITVLSLTMGGGGPLSMFGTLCVGFDVALGSRCLRPRWCPGKRAEYDSVLTFVLFLFLPYEVSSKSKLRLH